MGVVAASDMERQGFAVKRATVKASSQAVALGPQVLEGESGSDHQVSQHLCIKAGLPFPQALWQIPLHDPKATRSPV